MLLKTLIKESNHGQYRAEIHKVGENNFYVEYYSPSSNIKTENYNNSSILFVENMASNWLNSIKVLNG
jgi:hypothetical protein